MFSQAEVAANRAFFDRGLAECAARGRDENAINGFHTKLKSVYKLASDPRLLAIVNDLLCGEPFACVMTNYLCKLPKSDRWVPWHQDAVYWPFQTSRIVQIYLAIDDQDEENGAMKMIEGSHRLGKLKWHDTQADLNDSDTLSQTSWLWQQIDDFGAPPRPEVADTAQQGGCVTHSQWMQGPSDVHAHSSSPGTGGRNCRDGSRHSRIVNGRSDERETVTTASIDAFAPESPALA